MRSSTTTSTPTPLRRSMTEESNRAPQQTPYTTPKARATQGTKHTISQSQLTIEPLRKEQPVKMQTEADDYVSSPSDEEIAPKKPQNLTSSTTASRVSTTIKKSDLTNWGEDDEELPPPRKVPAASTAGSGRTGTATPGVLAKTPSQKEMQIQELDGEWDYSDSDN